MVNGSKNIFYEKDGELHKSELVLESEEKLEDIIQQIVARVNRSETFFITDLNSTNGSFLNRIRLKPFEKTEIKEGDSVIFSHHEYEFCFLY